MNYTIFFTICSLLYSIMLIFVIHKQKLIKTSNNLVFRGLAITNLVAIIVEIICTISAIYIKSNTIFMEALVRLFLISLLAWMIIFTLYMFATLYDEKNKSKKDVKKVMKKACLLAFTIFIITSIIVIILPVKYNFKKIYSYGLAINFVNYFSDFCMLFSLIYLFKNYSKTKNTKVSPFFAFIAGGVIMSIFQSYDPKLLLVNTIETFVTFMIYFTLDKSKSDAIESNKIIYDNCEDNNHGTKN